MGVDWLQAGRATAPADRDTAERAIRALYRLRDLPKPTVRWVASPAAGVAAYVAASNRAPLLNPDPRLTSWFRHSSFRVEFEALSDPFTIGWRRMEWLDRRVRGATSSWPPRDDSRDFVRRALVRTLPEHFVPGGNFDRPWTRRVRATAAAVQAMQAGQFDNQLAESARALANQGAKWVVRRSWPATALPTLEAHFDLVRSAGPWWAREGLAVISERPIRAVFDEGGRLHSTEGSALGWADDFNIWAIAGVSVPGWVVEEPERITVAGINREENIEVRRAMIERFGLDRLIREGGAKVAHEDRFGRLWRRPSAISASVSPASWWAEDEMLFVEVVNATAEPDGTFKTYFLRVPPWITSAAGGVAWTFGLTPLQYQPEVET